MDGSKKLEKMILRSDAFASRNTYKRAVLRGQLSLLGILVGAIYTGIDLTNDLYISLPFYVILILLCAVVFWINRKGEFLWANVIFLLLLVFLIYVFADNDVNRTGVSTYFIMYALIALTLSGFEEIGWGLFFCSLALIGFYVAYYVDLPPIIQPVEYSQHYVNISVFTNFLVSFLVAVSLLFFSLNINYKTEKELLQNNQLLTKTNQELDRFVYSASHDLRAPLTSVLGLIELSQKSKDSEEIQLCLEMMKSRIADLDAFIKEIIDYSRNARQEIRLEDFNLHELAEEVADGLRHGNGMESILIQYDIPQDLTVTTDRSRLKVILNNLIGNALKYSNPYQEAPVVSVKAGMKDHHLKIQVEDNGIGIGNEHLPKIFEMFYRASEKSQGSGLGLYIVKETLDKLKGNIQVKSTYGHGSTFSVEVPV
ncbi:MAG TPA: HAMP domain-containing sensor histidine kinase [Cyclobacteriaceae bacterium]|jgi:signal transduction histidine kinase|nr:HAMP domain-containing sensor histidine kinase [Cyclobacteriaceae bacterium]